MSKIQKIGLGIGICLILLSNIIFVKENWSSLKKVDILPEFSLSNLNITKSLIPDSCVYPSTYEIENASSYQIRGNYESLITISEGDAVNASLSFIKKTLPDELTSGLRTVNPEEGFWPGAPALIRDWWPRWSMTIISDNMEAAVYVNALSGKVVSYSLYAYNKSVESFTPIHNTEEAESLVVDFLELHNYTLMQDAVYDGINLLSQPNHPYYSVSFHQEVNHTLITFSEIYFEIDATYGVVREFTYKWIVIERLPIDRIIPTNDIPRIVQNSVNVSAWATIIDSTLQLRMTDFGPDTPEFVLRFVYAVKVVSTNVYIYIIDALSGDILSKDLLLSEPYLIVYAPYFQVTIIASVLVASALTYIFLRRRR